MKAVIFDMDGVLVNTEPIYMGIDREIFDNLGLKISPERQHTYIGIPGERMWTELRAEFGFKPTAEELITRVRKEIVTRLGAMSAIPVMEGVVGLLQLLKDRGLKLGVASSSTRAVIDLIMNKTGLISHFSATVSGHEVRRGKPAPDIFLETARRLEFPPNECLVVEDSPHGARGAKEAGMKVIGMANPCSGIQDLSHTDMVIRNYSADTLRRVTDFLNLNC